MVITFKPLSCKEIVVLIGKVVLNSKGWSGGKGGRGGGDKEECTGLEGMVWLWKLVYIVYVVEKWYQYSKFKIFIILNFNF